MENGESASIKQLERANKTNSCQEEIGLQMPKIMQGNVRRYGDCLTSKIKLEHQKKQFSICCSNSKNKFAYMDTA